MDSDGQQNGVHDLSQDKLYDLIFELFSDEADYKDPGAHVDSVCNNEVAKEHISHHENERERQLNL